MTQGTSLKTQSEIRERLVALIALHTGASVKSIARESSIWDNFQPSKDRGEHPTVTSFINGVQSEFKVYLTEEEWEDPTPESLAHAVRAKLENPTASLADWTRERNEELKGIKVSMAFVTVLFGPIAFFSASGSLNRRVLVVTLLVLVFNLMLLGIYYDKKRKEPLARI